MSNKSRTSALSGKGVLLLSHHYEPYRFASVETAARLIYARGAVRATDSNLKVLHSVRSRIEIPLAIVTRGVIPKRYRTVALNRKNLLERDRHTCQYCGQVGGRLTIDHVTPTSRGGENEWENVVVACFRCNNRKDARTPFEAGMVLLTKPRQPSRLAWLRRGLRPEELHPELRPLLFAASDWRRQNLEFDDEAVA